jgi:hypothetical protein
LARLEPIDAPSSVAVDGIGARLGQYAAGAEVLIPNATSAADGKPHCHTDVD